MDEIKLETIYTAQSYINQDIVAAKRASRDYTIQVALLDDDGCMIPVLVDGNHSYRAAIADGVLPVIQIVEANEKSLERYVTGFNDLSNPVNIVSGRELW